MSYLHSSGQGKELDHESSIKMGVDVTMEGPHARIVVDESQDSVSEGLQGDSVSAKWVDRIERTLPRDVSSFALTNDIHLVSMLICLKEKKKQKGEQVKEENVQKQRRDLNI